MKIVLLGPSGAGKGSIAEKLTGSFPIVHISSGQLFRQHVAKKTRIGIKAGKYINKGLFAPDKLTVEMIKERIKQPDCKSGFILDGFPRTINQAELFDKISPIDFAIQLDISDEVVTERLGGRYMCSKCHAIHNIKIDEMKACKKCGQSGDDIFYQRDDDKTEYIVLRLSQYHENIADILNFYKNRGKLLTVHIDSTDNLDIVYKKVIDTMFNL